MAEDHDPSSRGAQCGPVLCGGRDAGSATPSSSGAAGALPEVPDGIPGEEETCLPAILLCLGSSTSGNSWTSQ